ncbi:MAG TPA: coenzyme F420-0:L-glutamate ligase [Candidatus Bathyarchaeia archaeon]|nr:coenzyme F420-0:L-glutamate ligase [Candidatus Bathyarchaeia archaeon]
MKSFTVVSLDDFPLINAGDDLAKIIVETVEKNGLSLEDGDVLAIAQKIFSKAENKVVRLKDVVPSEEAKSIAKLTARNPKLIELTLRDTNKIVKASREIFIVEDKRGLVCINAGIDKSNVKGKDSFALLPENPDESARKCREEIKRLTGKNVAIVVCDTYSRPFRRGQVNFAIGIAGIKTFKDYRGKKDLFNQILKVKNIAVVDEIAAAAELLMGQAKEAAPVIILRGLNGFVSFCEKCGINELFISSQEDLFKDTLCPP